MQVFFEIAGQCFYTVESRDEQGRNVLTFYQFLSNGEQRKEWLGSMGRHIATSRRLAKYVLGTTCKLKRRLWGTFIPDGLEQ